MKEFPIWEVLFTIFAILLIARSRVMTPDVKKLKQRAEQQFQQAEAHSAEPRYGIVAREAEIMMEKENFSNPNNNRSATYVLTRFLRNAHGEYFMFIGGEAAPYIKHVEKRLAKIELGKRYKE